MDINTTHKDEEVTVDILVQDANGNPIAAPALHAVSMVISDTGGGAALGNTKYDFTLADSGTARFRRVLSPSDLSALTEGVTYHYNIWSKETAKVPVLRDKGTISLLQSISLPA